jgi:hypothetical protein
MSMIGLAWMLGIDVLPMWWSSSKFGPKAGATTAAACAKAEGQDGS